MEVVCLQKTHLKESQRFNMGGGGGGGGNKVYSQDRENSIKG